MPALRGISEARASRILVAAVLALVVTGGVAFLGLQVSHDYTASIGLIGTIDRTSAQSEATSLSTELPAVVQAALTDDVIADIDDRVHPYSAIASRLFPKWTTARLRSELGVENIYSGTTIGAVALVFTGNNRETALKVTSAAAELLLKHPDASQVAPQDQAHLPPAAPSEQASQPRPTETPETDVAAPTAPPPAEAAAVDSLQLKAIRELRGQLAALARTGQDLETQISTKTDSVTAIEQEKEHIRQSVLVALPTPRPVPIPPDPKRAALQSKLAAYEKVLAALRDRYTEDYPDVINARERVEELQADIAQLPRPPAVVERREMPRPASDVPQRLQVLEERERPMEADLEQMRTKLKANEARAASLRHLLMTMPAKAETQPAASLAPAPVPAAVLPTPVQPTAHPLPVPERDAASVLPIQSRFSIATPAEIRRTEQLLSPEAVATVSVICGLGTGFAYLALGAGRRTRRPREEPEPHEATI